MTARLQKAIDFMKAAHRSIDQRRKDNVRLYEVHPLDVLARLQAAGVTDEDILIAALLHDVIEDVFPKNEFYQISEIERNFGLRVGGFVLELTDEYTKQNYPDLNRRARKQLERERYATFSDEAKLVKLADIASNLADDGTVLEADGRVEVGFNQMFIKEKSKCLPYLMPVPTTPLGSRMEDEPPIYAIHGRLWDEAARILLEQKIKFDVR
jgi:(p)ppGpp synthase/HD superfamily hydrolase